MHNSVHLRGYGDGPYISEPALIHVVQEGDAVDDADNEDAAAALVQRLVDDAPARENARKSRRRDELALRLYNMGINELSMG